MEESRESLEALYTHVKRPKWGLAILAWEGRESRHYQFQDGQLRTIKDGWYHLLEPVDEPYDSARDIVRDLKSMLRIERVRRAPDPTPRSVKSIISFDEQIKIFRHFTRRASRTRSGSPRSGAPRTGTVSSGTVSPLSSSRKSCLKRASFAAWWSRTTGTRSPSV